MSDKSRTDHNQAMLDTLFLDGGNAAYLEQMLAKYMANPSSVDPSWQDYLGPWAKSLAMRSKMPKARAGNVRIGPPIPMAN